MPHLPEDQMPLTRPWKFALDLSTLFYIVAFVGTPIFFVWYMVHYA